mmetsp:Transcript_7392/g.10581  ORF Transcript_7392/g.10581 Transcript_7392/m.10581 type:complete len:103 (+) Transcript_7392:1264-1572(+)
MVELPEMDKIAIKLRVNNVINELNRDPKTAVQALPPSSLPMGSKFRAEDIRPAKPTTKAGWIGIGCERGTNIVLGASIDMIDPVRKLHFKRAAGTTGKNESC